MWSHRRADAALPSGRGAPTGCGCRHLEQQLGPRPVPPRGEEAVAPFVELLEALVRRLRVAPVERRARRPAARRRRRRLGVAGGVGGVVAAAAVCGAGGITVGRAVGLVAAVDRARLCCGPGGEAQRLHFERPHANEARAECVRQEQRDDRHEQADRHSPGHREDRCLAAAPAATRVSKRGRLGCEGGEVGAHLPVLVVVVAEAREPDLSDHRPGDGRSWAHSATVGLGSHAALRCASGARQRRRARMRKNLQEEQKRNTEALCYLGLPGERAAGDRMGDCKSAVCGSASAATATSRSSSRSRSTYGWSTHAER